MAMMPLYVWIGLSLLGILVGGLIIWLLTDLIGAYKRRRDARLQPHDVGQDRHAHE